MKHKYLEFSEVLLIIFLEIFAIGIGFYVGICAGIITGIVGLAIVLFDRYVETKDTVLRFDEDGVEAFLGERQLFFIPWDQFKTAGTYTTRATYSAYVSFLTKEELQAMPPHLRGRSINEWLGRDDWLDEVKERPLFVVPKLSSMKDGSTVLTRLLAVRGRYVQKHGGEPIDVYCFKL